MAFQHEPISARSWLFAPGDSDKKMGKATDGAADIVLIDLEDAVAPENKELARGMVHTVNHPSAGELKLVGIPFRMNGTPPAVRRPPPLLGEHTDEVFGEELGLGGERLAQLRAAKVI